jgi:hypothetical protein
VKDYHVKGLGMEKYILATVDCDMGIEETVAKRNQNLDVMLNVFEECGFSGHATWFLNEHRLEITRNHQSFLREAVRRGDTIGIHDHIDRLEGKKLTDAIYAFGRESLDRVTRWLKANGHSGDVFAHRMGCLYQRTEAYQALARLNYSVVSEVYPGHQMPDHALEESFDNRNIPPGTGPFRHDAENFLEYTSTRGRFLHFPVFHLFMYNFDFPKLAACLDRAEKEKRSAMFIVWCIHPYELTVGGWEQGGWDWTKIDEAKVEKLKNELTRMKTEFGLKPANVKFSAQRLTEKGG